MFFIIVNNNLFYSQTGHKKTAGDVAYSSDCVIVVTRLHLLPAFVSLAAADEEDDRIKEKIKDTLLELFEAGDVEDDIYDDNGDVCVITIKGINTRIQRKLENGRLRLEIAAEVGFDVHCTHFFFTPVHACPHS